MYKILREIIIFVFFLILFAIILQTLKHYKNEINRLSMNQKIYLMNTKEEITLLRSEFKDKFGDVIFKLNDIKIKSKNVEHYIDFKYYFKDSILTKIVMDTISNVKKFSYEDNCIYITGHVNDSDVSIDYALTDTFKVIIYFKKNKDFSWWKRLWNKHLRYKRDVLIYSVCKGDTIRAENSFYIIDGGK